TVHLAGALLRCGCLASQARRLPSGCCGPQRPGSTAAGLERVRAGGWLGQLACWKVQHQQGGTQAALLQFAVQEEWRALTSRYWRPQARPPPPWLGCVHGGLCGCSTGKALMGSCMV
ncbi:hypothetical protein V8C86DRAFT_2655738, partial [Haematococcus lacustris]